MGILGPNSMPTVMLLRLWSSHPLIVTHLNRIRTSCWEGLLYRLHLLRKVVIGSLGIIEHFLQAELPPGMLESGRVN